MQISYADELKNPIRVYQLILEGMINPQVQAVYYTIEEMIGNAERMNDNDLEHLSDEQLRYYSVVKKTLSDILKLPDKAKQELEALDNKEDE